jgi:cytochrome P450
MDVITRAVFGVADPARRVELGRRMQAVVGPRTTTIGFLARALSGRRLGARGTERFAERRRTADELIYDEIARRRSAPDLEEREDVLSLLLLARYEDGDAMSDEEVRDDLVTLLLAGYATTAATLAWTFDLLLRHPGVLERLRAELAAGDRDYLRAVIKEVLRIRPVVNNVGRTVAAQPYALGGYTLPPGTEITPSIAGIHRRPDRYPDPHEFRPERFLGPDAPDTYTWLPFGGGTRRCLGADFSTFEMGIVIPRVLERTRLEPARRLARPLGRRASHVVNLDRGMRRGIFYVPGSGVPVVQAEAPRAG